MRKQRYLVLEDGTTFKGYRFGSDKEVVGEIVFNTAMTGYQETLSDPSYTGQIITFTYPLIGNYGINRDDFETLNPSLKGMVVREACDLPSNFRNMATLDETLKSYDVPGIDGVDTRKLTRIIRQHGVLKAAIINDEKDIDATIERLKVESLPTDEVAQVSTKSAYVSTGNDLRVVLIDFGKKENIVRELNLRGCDVTVMPYTTTAEEIIRLRPDGVMLSNGPGNPEVVTEGIEMIKGILGKVPFFGICLGHQLFALASGATTFKMKFGHRGANHPVKNLATGKIEITSQNHGYSVDPESIKNTDLEITHTALNDGTVEGLKHKSLPAFSVQYHPEASPGPHDPNYLFDQFIDLMKENKERVTNA
ncbi:glutamine-hydrolyzing carbamoyl-phosphate synthase small subunit [Macrococcoides canis]|uniref:Carbamoyl phosphate synthase small chain n=1 Tax=Macrococcoides canis TaxID=1855823 RepID=A0A4R6C6Z0_9STAP|nr:glutamine-hydrolyzing carbamoyl-phosphate synthase small subunit [Macrococcus canis]QCT74606.1 carbamoyl-phosphate synthase small subunit [Macrococcus canis]QNR07620.1 glutamine-hydrolyzing carbamoyl-phosphate synthase small subunit [Macrococcus canis]QUR93698.1 glutamine-hydrolyzing carbamoyl-phosphate synthase small subunit [Macrococcus canis]TDM17942.1 carbamoyl-phosphate synthase small subunit [Macrococcus canis]TDM37911.1 carbamoyl-phosphate synthase small subunit [Macrococcus canis]